MRHLPPRIQTLCTLLILCAPAIPTARAQTAGNQGPEQFGRTLNPADSIVTLSGEDRTGRPLTPGRAFFVGANLAATDYGLIRDAVKLRVTTADGVEQDARVVAVDERFAIAVLSTGPMNKPPLPLSETRRPAAGDEVFLASSPGAFEQDTVSDIISEGSKRYLRLKAQMSSDRRGSPVFNNQREVVGIVVAGPGQDYVASFFVPVSYLVSLGYGTPFASLRKEADEEPAAEGVAGSPGGIAAVGGIPDNGAPGDASVPKVIRKAGGVLQGEALRKAAPQFPPLAKAARVSGAVVVEVGVDEEGYVISARAVLGHPLLKESAVRAARAWLFTPTTLSGVPVKVIGTITFNFTL